MSSRESTEREQPRGSDDPLLLRRFADGDRDALAEFVRRWETPMLKIACRIVGQIADAEEVRQSVFLKIVQNPERVIEIRNPAAWLRRCVVNEAITSIRTRERQQCEPLSEVIGTTPNGIADDDSRMLSDAMQTLDPPTRAMLSLRFDEGLTIREIADVLETPHTTIQSQLQSAMAALRSRLNARPAEARS